MTKAGFVLSGGTTLSDHLFINNVFAVGYDRENASPRERFISFHVTKHW